MKKLFRPKDLLKLGLALTLDGLQEIQDPLQLFSGVYENIYGWTPRRYRRRNFYEVVKRELKTGNIEKIEKKGELYLRLTSIGKKQVVRDFPLLFLQKEKWDGKWRVVSFDIAEYSKNVRERLRLKLKELGFGMMQESIWITPFNFGIDLTEFIESNGLEDMVFIFEAKKLLLGDEKTLAVKIWDLDKLAQKYEDIENDIHRLSSCRSTKYAFKDSLDTKFRKIKQDYLRILLTDPCLPKELLPENWVGERVRNTFKSFDLKD